MDAPTSDEEIQIPPETPSAEGKNAQAATRIPVIIVGIVTSFVRALPLLYPLRPEPLLAKGGVNTTRLDFGAVEGGVREILTERGQNIDAGGVLARIGNPEAVAKLEPMNAARAVAEAQLANVPVGARAETNSPDMVRPEVAQGRVLELVAKAPLI